MPQDFAHIDSSLREPVQPDQDKYSAHKGSGLSHYGTGQSQSDSGLLHSDTVRSGFKDNVKLEPDYTKTLDYLRRLCSMREYCRRDVYDKAFKRLEDKDAARRAVDTLVAEKFVDESRYALAFARDKASIRGWGPMKIRMALSGKGVPRDLIDDALAEIDGSKADDKLRKALQAKARQLHGDSQIRLKLLRFALGRGYGYDTANSLVAELLSEEEC